MFAGWLFGEKEIQGFEGRFVVPLGRVNGLVPVMRFSCAGIASTGCDKGSSA